MSNLKPYVVVFDWQDGVWTECYMAADHDDAVALCKHENPPDTRILHTARIPFSFIERAYILSKERRS